MDLFEGIKTRRSIRKYTDKVPGRDIVLRILDAANWAPSGMGEQPWEFAVVGGEPLNKLRDICRDVINLRLPSVDERSEQQKAFAHWYSTLGGAPLAIVAFCKREEDPGRRRMALESVSAAFQNLLLAAHGEGLGTCWMTGPLAKGDSIQTLLALPTDKEVVAITPLGYPNEQPKPSARQDPQLQTKVTWVGL